MAQRVVRGVHGLSDDQRSRPSSTTSGWSTRSRTKAWGLAADQRSSSHPIAGNGAADAQQALSDFDGISYSKGAAALRQLNAYLGDEAFIAGVVDHLKTHSYGNATLADLLDCWDRASDKDVTAWATAWLRTKGVDTLSVERPRTSHDVVIRRHNGSPEPVSPSPCVHGHGVRRRRRDRPTGTSRSRETA